MPFVLRTESLDDSPDERPFETEDAAIEAAVGWFLDGYEGLEVPKERLDEDTDRIRSDLRERREFYCNRFYEKISLHHTGRIEGE